MPGRSRSLARGRKVADAGSPPPSPDRNFFGRSSEVCLRGFPSSMLTSIRGAITLSATTTPMSNATRS